jgi:hypothetical protein
MVTFITNAKYNLIFECDILWLDILKGVPRFLLLASFVTLLVLVGLVGILSLFFYFGFTKNTTFLIVEIGLYVAAYWGGAFFV